MTIPGHEHIPGVLYGSSDPPPDHCHECGEAFPWKNEKEEVQPMSPDVTTTKTVFIVHGHDEEMKQAVARTLSDLDLKPIILHEQPNEGKTVIEKFEKHADTGFAVVLLSSDDMAFQLGKDATTAKSRARQNVILELVDHHYSSDG
jgi:predicted nucleotide-binding protein